MKQALFFSIQYLVFWQALNKNKFPKVGLQYQPDPHIFDPSDSLKLKLTSLSLSLFLSLSPISLSLPPSLFPFESVEQMFQLF